mmetsp:Transcript_15071/g.17208  ORF Transcript_15071/g.17208 Transcript_15071/m.17208 type:complete len:476 (+) Transcript_15071:35-1462(+)
MKSLEADKSVNCNIENPTKFPDSVDLIENNAQVKKVINELVDEIGLVKSARQVLCSKCIMLEPIRDLLGQERVSEDEFSPEGKDESFPSALKHEAILSLLKEAQMYQNDSRRLFDELKSAESKQKVTEKALERSKDEIMQHLKSIEDLNVELASRLSEKSICSGKMKQFQTALCQAWKTIQKNEKMLSDMDIFFERKEDEISVYLNEIDVLRDQKHTEVSENSRSPVTSVRKDRSSSSFNNESKSTDQTRHVISTNQLLELKQENVLLKNVIESILGETMLQEEKVKRKHDAISTSPVSSDGANDFYQASATFSFPDSEEADIGNENGSFVDYLNFKLQQNSILIRDALDDMDDNGGPSNQTEITQGDEMVSVVDIPTVDYKEYEKLRRKCDTLEAERDDVLNDTFALLDITKREHSAEIEVLTARVKNEATIDIMKCKEEADKKLRRLTDEFSERYEKLKVFHVLQMNTGFVTP